MRGWLPVWTGLFLKRYWKKPGYLILLCLLPGALFLCSRIPVSREQDYEAVCFLPETPILTELKERLLASDSTVQFVMADSEEAVMRLAAAGRAACGYIFPEDFERRLWEEDGAKSIVCYTGEDRTVSLLSNQIILNELFQIYSRQGYREKIGQKFGEEYLERGMELLEKRLFDGSTFAFDYAGDMRREEEHGKTDEIRLTDQVLPMRGMLAVFLLLAALLGLMEYQKDVEKGRYVWVQGKWRVQLLAVGIPLTVEAAVGLCSLAASGKWGNGMQEVGAMIVYMALLQVFCFVWGKICGTEHRIAVSVPFLLLCCFVFSPIFWNLKSVLPALAAVEKLLPSTWYLMLL